MIPAQTLYNLLLTLLALPALPVAGLALLLRPRYRLGLAQRLGFLPQEVLNCDKEQQPLWLHAPSVGEILATRPFLRALKLAFPRTPLVLSALTPTAYATAREKIPEADAVIYLPLDHPFFIQRVLRAIRPAAFFFTETELWPNLLLTLAHRRVPTFLVSGRFSAHAHARYRWLRPLFQPVFLGITRCCMQTTADAERLKAAGAPRRHVVVTGNFKVDNASAGGPQGLAVLQEAGFAGRPLLVGASTHPTEEAFLLRVFRRLRAHIPNLLLLLAPRHPQRFADVELLLQQNGHRYVKRSQLEYAKDSNAAVFLLDTLGELASFYRAAVITFVGGSLIKGPGGHSVVEPALAETPVCFGPYMGNFVTLVEQLMQAGGGFMVRTEEDAYRQLLALFSNLPEAREAGRRAHQVIAQGQGAVQRTMTVVLEALQQSGTNLRHADS
ncbi:MAG: 3-deoxy-D-manno-octulosonic acid transferase [Deltaproteobacteria bacterium]|nr:3-deoxy-D-manno-octulosonic acid transferase [Deltaproteobacteria bacterium]